MQHLALCLAALAGLRGAAAAADGVFATTPVEKIVKLLEQLKDEAESTGNKEKKAYEDYSSWCADTTKEKGKAIEEAKSSLVQLGGDIQENTAKVSSGTTNIEKLVTDIKKAEDGNKDALAIRKKEHEEWVAEEKELTQAIRALDAAVVVLTGAQTKRGAPEELLQRADWRAVATAVPRVQLDLKKASLLSAWLAKAEASEKSGYTPASSEILGILEQLHEDFKTALEEGSKEETGKQEAFDKLMGTRLQELDDMRAEAEKKAGEKADAQKLLAEQSEVYDETDKQLKSDKKFFQAIQCSCLAKKLEYEERSKLREEELAGIDKALEILTSDDAKELFSKSMDDASRVQFLQLDAVENAAPVMKAFKALKAMATKAHSIRLAKLAARVRVSTMGHFDKVIAEIDKVIQMLKDEEQEDIAKRDQCKDEYQNIATTVADLEWKIENNKAEIAKLETRLEDTETEKAKTIEDIAKTAEEIGKMETTRKTEHEDFLQEKSNDEKAIELINSARDTLAKYYERRGKSVSAIKLAVQSQPKRAAHALVQFDPELDCESFKAQGPQFSKQDKNQRQTRGIVGLMTLLVEDLKEEISNSIKADEASQTEFAAALGAAKKLKSDLEGKKVTLEGIIADTQEDIGTEDKKKEDNNKDLKAQNDFEEEIKPNCDWIIEKFETRRDARKAEMDGLVEAKEYLAGAKVEAEEDYSGLLQRPSPRRFDDGAFDSIDFSRLSFLQRRQ